MKPQPRFAYDIYPLIQQRWSPRAFSTQPVAEEQIMMLFEAARWAASSGNEQPWRFIYATQAQAERYGQLAACLSESNRVWATAAPALILTLARTTSSRSGQPNRYALHDVGLATGNLSLQAAALDLFVHPMGGFSGEKARQLFDLPPELEPVAMIAVGYLGDPEQLPENLKERELAPRQRRPLEELILK